MKEFEREYCYICLVLLSAFAVNPYSGKDVNIRKGLLDTRFGRSQGFKCSLGILRHVPFLWFDSEMSPHRLTS